MHICTNYLISVGKNNRYGHPNKEVLDNLSNSKIYRTDKDGSIMFKIKNDKLKIETCAPKKKKKNKKVWYNRIIKTIERLKENYYDNYWEHNKIICFNR